MGRLQAAVTMVSTNVLKLIQENDMRLTAIWLDMEGGPLNMNMNCNWKLQLVWLFDTLHCLMGACILKTNHLRHTYFDIFNLFFNMTLWRTSMAILFHHVYLTCTSNIVQQWYIRHNKMSTGNLQCNWRLLHKPHWNVLLTLCIGSGLSSINSSRFPEIARFSSGPASCSVRSPACWEKLCFSCIPTRGMKEQKVSPWQG